MPFPLMKGFAGMLHCHIVGDTGMMPPLWFMDGLPGSPLELSGLILSNIFSQVAHPPVGAGQCVYPSEISV